MWIAQQQPQMALLLLLMERQAFAQRLRTLRHRAELTQAQVAHRTGATHRAYSDWELGSRTPSAKFLPALAESLAVPLEQLYVPEGWWALPVPHLRPETVARMVASPEGFEAVYAAVCARVREAMEDVRPIAPARPGRQRRSREDVLLKGHKPPAKRGRGGGTGGKV